MRWKNTTGLALLAMAVTGTALAAERATLADAAERRDRAAIRAELTRGVDVNAESTARLRSMAHITEGRPCVVIMRAPMSTPPIATACLRSRWPLRMERGVLRQFSTLGLRQATTTGRERAHESGARLERRR